MRSAATCPLICAIQRRLEFLLGEPSSNSNACAYFAHTYNIYNIYRTYHNYPFYSRVPQYSPYLRYPRPLPPSRLPPNQGQARPSQVISVCPTLSAE